MLGAASASPSPEARPVNVVGFGRLLPGFGYAKGRPRLLKRTEAGAEVLDLSGESAGGRTLSGEGVSRARSGRRGRAKPCGGSRSLEVRAEPCALRMA